MIFVNLQSCVIVSIIHSRTLKKGPLQFPPSHPRPLAFADLLCMHICLFWAFHTRAISKRVGFGVFFASGFLHWACFWDSLSQHLPALCSFVSPNGNSLYEFARFCFSMCHLMDTWVVSTVWQLWVMLLWTSVCQLLCRPVFISLGYVPRRGDCCILCSLCVQLFETLPICFLFCIWILKWLHYFAFPPAVYEGSAFSTLDSTLVICHRFLLPSL